MSFNSILWIPAPNLQGWGRALSFQFHFMDSRATTNPPSLRHGGYLSIPFYGFRAVMGWRSAFAVLNLSIPFYGFIAPVVGALKAGLLSIPFYGFPRTCTPRGTASTLYLSILFYGFFSIRFFNVNHSRPGFQFHFMDSSSLLLILPASMHGLHFQFHFMDSHACVSR